jgi:hypothetical protein
MRGLLKTIDASFPDMTREQRRTVHSNLARTCRQLTYDATSSVCHRAAFHYAAEAFGYKHDMRAAADLLGSIVRWAFRSPRQGGDRSPRTLPAIQAAFDTVR